MRLPGHPDAACDLVAEALVDEYLRRDPETRIRVEVQGGHGALFVTGDVLTKADPDASAIVKRALASAGVMSDIEPFVALERAASEQVVHVQGGSPMPVTVMGYATNETPERIPLALSYARAITRAIEEHRANDSDWFWAGSDGEISVMLPAGKAPSVHVRIEHGALPIEEARLRLATLVKQIMPTAELQMNANGAQPVRGLAQAIGASGRGPSAYGSGLPSASPAIGLGIHDIRKSGAWLARSVARELLAASEAKAILLQATYLPGDILPSYISARDERGRDLSAQVRHDDLDIRRVSQSWMRSGLNAEAALWGFVGTPGLPWEA